MEVRGNAGGHQSAHAEANRGLGSGGGAACRLSVIQCPCDFLGLSAYHSDRITGLWSLAPRQASRATRPRLYHSA